RVVVLPARELAHAADGGVDGTEAVALALPPDHPLVVRRRDLPAPLHESAVGVEEELRVVEGAAVTLVDAERDHDPETPRRLRHGIDGGPGNDDRLLVELEVSPAHRGRRED